MSDHLRKSHTTLGRIYFWTATIHNLQPLLEKEVNKKILFDYLSKLSSEGFITVYALVIMPTHIHIIWQQNKLNGKESPFGSFLKYTAHQMLKLIKNEQLEHKYRVKMANKNHQIWMRDSLAIEILNKKIAVQKLNYIHANPITGKWGLAKNDIDYFYSTARFYETGVDEFGFLKDIFEMFDGE